MLTYFGDDFVVLAAQAELEWFFEEIQKFMTTKNRGIMGPDANGVKEIRLLNRISWLGAQSPPCCKTKTFCITLCEYT